MPPDGTAVQDAPSTPGTAGVRRSTLADHYGMPLVVVLREFGD